MSDLINKNNSYSIEEVRPVYFPNEGCVVDKLFNPIAKDSSGFKCMSGYFTSSVLRELAAPLSLMFSKKGMKGQFIISPNLSEDDMNALLDASRAGESIYEFIFSNESDIHDRLVNSTLNVLKLLILSGRLEFKIALMKKGMMHAKIWLFETSLGTLSVSGSGNATVSGLIHNFEQLVVSKSWMSKNEREIVDSFSNRFESFFTNRRKDSVTLPINDKTMDVIKSVTNQYEGNEALALEDLDEALLEFAPTRKLKVPEWLNYRSGDYMHQGEAVDAWRSNGNKGILEIATGGGKTLTSLVCASLTLFDEKSSLLLIAVPTKPLIKQWAEDVRKFGIAPLDTEGIGTNQIIKEIKGVLRKQRFMDSVDVIILTHDALKQERIISAISKATSKVMLIADEVHNLGVDKFLCSDPNSFDCLLGLSATPVRQYDQEGSDKLLEYMGRVVYSFSLEDAIGNCLVPFKYYPHRVMLTAEEEDEWLQYTEKINSMMWNKEDKSAKAMIEQLMIRRRAIIESASNKIEKFRTLMDMGEDKKYSLVFCTDKNPDQILEVNETLRECNYIFHQITGEETSNPKVMDTLIESYKSGGINILTSKRVLNEGFNIPPIKEAYFMASSGTKRTWVQRLGRVLRLSPETDKKYSEVHDFIVYPISNNKKFKTFLKSEVERVQWFAELSMNGTENSGSFDVMKEISEMMEEV
jgi:superfamily II DNA or RNA helicase